MMDSFQGEGEMKNQMRTSAVRWLIASICGLMIAVTFFFVSAPNAQAKPNATITVNTLLDTIANDGLCSLREAIQSAESGMPIGNCASGSLSVDTINITATGTIVLNSTLPVITQDVNIVGPGSGLLTISGAGAYRPITITASAKMNLSGVTVANGFATSSGAGVYNAGTLTITNASVFNNATTVVGASSGGGGIYNKTGGILTLINTSIYSNTSTTDGGGFFNYGTATISNTAVFSNTATGAGGGIYNNSNGVMTILNSNVYSNTGNVNSGGIDVDYSTLTITGSSVHDNTTQGYGGGFNMNRGIVTMTNSSIYDNVALSGGGVYADNNTTLNIHGTTFYGNRAVSGAGGGIIIANSGTQNITVTNSTFFNNKAEWMFGSGGGIFLANTSGNLNIINTTFSANKATYGGNINQNAGTVTLQNTIIANSVSGRNCVGTITNGGNNLQFGGTLADSCGATIATADPKLASLENYGGPTKTMALYPGSAAINAGNNAVCTAAPINNLDQRGYVRPVGGTCDIGAFEGELTLLYLPFISK
jgi:CSLREA domain-containing protein